MRSLPLMLTGLAAYGVLVLLSTTALYYLELERTEETLAATVRRSLADGLRDHPGFEWDIHFEARHAHVRGIAPSLEALQAARDTLFILEGPEAGSLPHEPAGWTQDLKVRSSLHVSREGASLHVQACLPPDALAALEEGLLQARDAQTLHGPSAALAPGPGDTRPASRATVPQIDAAPAPWHQRLKAFTAYFFQPGRALNADFRLSDGEAFILAGEVGSEAEREEILRFAAACFPDGVPPLEDRLQVVRRVQPFLLYENEGIVSVEGMVPSLEEQDVLFELVRSQGAPGQSFVNGLQVVEDVTAPAWLKSKPTFFSELLSEIRHPAIVIGPREILLKGEAKSREAGQALVRKIQSELEAHEVNVGLSYPQPGVSLAGESSKE